MAPVVSPDGKTAYVLNRFHNTVSSVDVGRMKVAATLPVLREPHAAVLGAGGRLLFVANHLPACRATDDVVAASVSVIDTATFKLLKNVMLPNGSTGVRGIGASPDGKTVYVTHTFGRYQLPTTQLERGWMNTAGLSVLSGETGDYVNTALLDDVDLGAANPWGVAVSADGKSLLVAHAGTREISVIDREAFHARLEKAAQNEKVTEVTKTAADVPNDLSFLVTIRRRVKVGGDGPRGLAVTPDGRAFAACYFADALAEVRLADAAPKSALLPLGPEVDLSKDRVRRGEMLWNDGAMCFQQWQSCASCHPDGRADGLNWDLVNDGIGNPKQSRSMLYTHRTSPVMITGIRASAEVAVLKGFTMIQFHEVTEDRLDAVNAYLKTLEPVPSPYLGADGKLTSSALRGKALFEGKADCARCHTPPYYGDKKKYVLGLGSDSERDREFATPILVEVWRTAPYMYDGRAVTMREVVTTDNANNRHGNTKGLTPEEVDDLVSYVNSL
jgi:YVTN family beta-propeller protein